MGQVIEIALEFLVLDGFSRLGVGVSRHGGMRYHGCICAAKLACPVRILVLKLPQLLGPLVPDLSDCPRFSVLGIAFPLAGLMWILLQIEDSFCCHSKKSGVREREVGAEGLTLGVLENVDIDRHARGVFIVALDHEWKIDGVDGMDSCAALLDV